jgi:hypothetical protein
MHLCGVPVREVGKCRLLYQNQSIISRLVGFGYQTIVLY